MNALSPSTEPGAIDLSALISELPITITVADIATLGTFDAHELSSLVRQALDGANASEREQIRGSIEGRRPDMDAWLPALFIDVSARSIEISCEVVTLLTVERGQPT